jgi:hypothetical protein
MEGAATNLKETLDLWWKPPPTAAEDIRDWVDRATCYGTRAFAMGALGYAIPGHPLDDWREVGRRLVAAVLYYFFGAWREKFTWMIGAAEQHPEELDRTRSRLELDWLSYYRHGLSVAASLSDWASADRLLKWPAPDLKVDLTLDHTAEDNAYQIWLAARLRGESDSSVAGQRAQVERGRRRRPKLLLATADALLAKDHGGSSAALEEYLRLCRKVPSEYDFGINPDGTTLWHFARRRKLGNILLSADVDLIIARA